MPFGRPALPPRFNLLVFTTVFRRIFYPHSADRTGHLNARARDARKVGQFNGGLSLGRTVTDTCEIVNTPQDARPGFCRTTLSWWQGHAKFLELDIMRALAASGANPRLTPRDGTTPLMVAAGVLGQGSRFDRRDRIALLRASDEAAALEAVKLAVDVGADVKCGKAPRRGSYGTSPSRKRLLDR